MEWMVDSLFSVSPLSGIPSFESILHTLVDRLVADPELNAAISVKMFLDHPKINEHLLKIVKIVCPLLENEIHAYRFDRIGIYLEFLFEIKRKWHNACRHIHSALDTSVLIDVLYICECKRVLFLATSILSDLLSVQEPSIDDLSKRIILD